MSQSDSSRGDSIGNAAGEISSASKQGDTSDSAYGACSASSGSTLQAPGESSSASRQGDTSDSAYGAGSASKREIETKQFVKLQEKVLKACENGQLDDAIKELVAVKKVELKYFKAKQQHGDTPLHIAAYYGHKKIIEYLIDEEGFDVESKNNYGKKPLHRAARQGKLEVVKYLVEEKKGNPMAVCMRSRTPLHNACKNGQLEVVKYLMSDPRVDRSVQDSFQQQTPLQLAAECGTVDVVQYMMENGVDREEPGPYTLLHLAAYGGKLDIVQYLIQKRNYDPMIRDKDDNTPLHSSCVNGQTKMVKYLVDEFKVEVSCKNRYQESPLDSAAKCGRMEIVKYLVEERNCSIEHGENQNTALHSAAWGGAMDAMKYFIEKKKCNASYRGRKGRTPLHSACYNGRGEMVDYLVDQHSVEVSCRDHDGATPLHLAAKKGHLQLVKQLVRKHKCDYCSTDNSNKTPLDYASKGNHTTTVEYLSLVRHITSNKQRKRLEEKLKKHIMSCRPTGAELGEGSYSVVIELKLDGDLSVCLAGKVFKTKSGGVKYEKKLIKEIEIMLELEHHNIVDCKGVYFQPDAPLPVLVMERLKTSLYTYLVDPSNSNLQLKRKVSILMDTARGLEYLHSHTPAIIHRDLTAKNVLLDSQLRAKIADFGNSRIMELHSGSSPGAMTNVPGTLNYMPPEATGTSVKYDTSLDVFSFGHLSLFTVIQSPVQPLLPATYDSNDILIARSEVERREEFIVRARALLLEGHALLELIQQCLRNKPTRRPPVAGLVTRLYAVKTTTRVQEPLDRNPEFPVIRGAVIIARTTVEITPDHPLSFHWEGHGFKVYIPAGAVSRRVTLCIQASLSGDYQLPDDGVLVSGVYWLSLHPHIEEFEKKVTISLQHCASVEGDESPLFIGAKCTQETLPYTFTPLAGGGFSTNDSTIQVTSFSAFAVFGKKAYYAISTHYFCKRTPTHYEAHITVVPDQELTLKAVKGECESKEGYEGGGHETAAQIERTISLSVPETDKPDITWENNGWELCSLLSTELDIGRIKDYEPGRVIPCFVISMKCAEPCQLEQKIYFSGVKQKTFITITRLPYQQDEEHLVQRKDKDCRHYSGSREPSEITALSTNLTQIIDTVATGISWFADGLVEKAFITRRAASGILGVQGISSAEKARKLMDSVFTKIDVSNDKSHWFREFLDIFCGDRAYTDLVDRLRRPGPGARNQRESGDSRMELGRQNIVQQEHRHLGPEDLFKVISALEPVIFKWKNIGLALGLTLSHLYMIERDQGNCEDRLTEVLSLWLNRDYEPSWEMLARAVGHRAGGNNPALAQEIAKIK